jgi:multidrug resistance efflux pump
MVNLLKRKQIAPSQQVAKKNLTKDELLQGTIFTFLAGTLSLGILMIRYHLTYISIDNVIINGRIIKVTAPVTGILKNLDAKPGTEVESAKILAKIGISPMVSAKKDLAKLKNKLQNLEKQYIDSEGEHNLGEEFIQLLSEVQAQETLVKNLEPEDKKQTQFKKISEVLVKAPLTAVVYTTTHEEGELVTQSQPILTLLDCNNLWLDTIIKADDAQNIDPNKPVKVKLSSYTQTVSGKITLIQPLNNFKYIEENSSKLTKVQALLPAIPSHLIGQALARVKVKIPRTGSQKIPWRFCGVGESADVVFVKK